MLRKHVLKSQTMKNAVAWKHVWENGPCRVLPDKSELCGSFWHRKAFSVFSTWVEFQERALWRLLDTIFPIYLNFVFSKEIRPKYSSSPSDGQIVILLTYLQVSFSSISPKLLHSIFHRPHCDWNWTGCPSFFPYFFDQLLLSCKWFPWFYLIPLSPKPNCWHWVYPTSNHGHVRSCSQSSCPSSASSTIHFFSFGFLVNKRKTAVL